MTMFDISFFIKEFMWGVEADYTYAGFLTKRWEMLAKKQVSFLPEYAKPGMLCFPLYLFKALYAY
jgi:hypothetical protein